MNSEKIRILLVDDHQMLRDGLRALLEGEDDLVVIGEAGTGAEGLALLRERLPDLVVVDLGLPDMSGLEVLREARALRADVKLVVLSMHTNRDYVAGAVEAGCDAYVPKSSAHTSLLEAIRVVMGGDRYLHPKAATALVESLAKNQSEAERLKALSEREVDVMRLTAMGFTGREIGEQLFISAKTVDTYRQRAMEKLGLAHRADMVRFALNVGLLDGMRENGNGNGNGDEGF